MPDIARYLRFSSVHFAGKNPRLCPMIAGYCRLLRDFIGTFCKGPHFGAHRRRQAGSRYPGKSLPISWVLSVRFVFYRYDLQGARRWRGKWRAMNGLQEAVFNCTILTPKIARGFDGFLAGWRRGRRTVLMGQGWRPRGSQRGDKQVAAGIQ